MPVGASVGSTLEFINNMDENQIEEKVGRAFEKFIGTGIFVISVLIFCLVIFLLLITIPNNALDSDVFIIALILALIGYALGTLSIRLITGRGIKGSTYLLSNTSLLFWGTVFGVAGVIEIFLAVFNDEYNLIIPGVGSLVMGLGSYSLVRRRKNEL